MKICVINTGGTISCVGKPLSPMSAADFGAASQKIIDPILAELFPETQLTYETNLIFSESSSGTLDSTNLQPSDWCNMAGYILNNYAEYDGFVILHGTDSMDFTGSALPFLLNVFNDEGICTATISKSIVITGSQVPMFYRDSSVSDLKLNFNTDAFQNMCGAVACARLDIPEVSVYFNSQLYRGNRVLKVNASKFQAFDSPNYPALASYAINMELNPDNILPGPASYEVSLSNPAARKKALLQLKTISAEIDKNPVMQFGAFPATYNAQNKTALIADLINACVSAGLKGLVLESYGEGNFPSGNPDNPENGAIYTALKTAAESGVLIVDSTQVISGIVNDSAYASGAWLPAVGALSAADMTPMASLVKTMILLSAATAHAWSLETVRRLIELNLCGEMMNVSRLDSRSNNVLLSGQSISALDGSAILCNDPIDGLKLNSSDGKLLWSPFKGSESKPTGRLVMRGDGNLVLYSDSGAPLWNSGAAVVANAASLLMISGSYSDSSLELCVYDYSHNKTSCILYSQSR